jgi:hypothetical protein
MESGYLFDQIRSSCKRVTETARYVTINQAAVASYAASLPLELIRQPEHNAASHYLGHAADTVSFFVILDSINFGSGYFPFLQKRPGMSGYFTIASSLNDHFCNHGPMTASFLADLTPAKCTNIFGQDHANTEVQELLVLFANALNDLGRMLLSDYQGSCVNLIKAAYGSAEDLVHLLSTMPYFKDVERYGTFDVSFYKRAQLMSADLALAFGKSGYGFFSDLNELTIFADNLVPHVLRMDGILSYDQGLAERIDTEVLIPPGSPEEIEIRASAVHTVELLVAQLGHKVSAMQLDYLLWNRGQQPYYKKTKPRHRARTIFY